MADFDIPGIGKVRMALTELAKHPAERSRSTTATAFKRQAIEELYTEIRAARIAGHSWKTISKAIAPLNLKISKTALPLMFAAIDKRYEKETGVAALPVMSHSSSRKKKES